MTRPVLRADRRLEAVVLQRSQIGAVTRLCQTMALRDGLAGVPVPDDGRLALVGDADGRDVGGREACPVRAPRARRELRRPDRFGIVLDLARCGKDLRELPLRDRHHPSVAAEDIARLDVVPWSSAST